MNALVRRAVTALSAVALITGLAPAGAHAAPAPSPEAPSAAVQARRGLLVRIQARQLSVGRAALPSATVRDITAAITSSEATSQVPARDYRVAVLAVAGNDWARATLVPRPGVELDAATVVVHRTGRPAVWSVVDLGTEGVGCDIAPAPVLRSLRLNCE